MSRSVRTHAVTAAIALMVSTSGTALANHQFADVDDGSFFGGAIEAIADAGCATGYDDGTFRPRDGITRGQFAFWLENCGGRAERDHDTATLDTDDETVDVVATTVQPGAQGAAGLGGQGQYVVVIATYDVATAGTDLPCNVELTLDDQGGNVNPGDVPTQVVQIQSETTDFVERANGSMTMLVPVDAENATTVTLEATRPAQPGCASDIAVNGSVLMMSFPFNGVSNGFQG